jgi:hypothetical protein
MRRRAHRAGRPWEYPRKLIWTRGHKSAFASADITRRLEDPGNVCVSLRAAGWAVSAALNLVQFPQFRAV